MLDVRYGVSRINTKNLHGNKEGFDDYTAFGVPANLQPLMPAPGRRAGRQPERLHRRQRRRQQLVGALRPAPSAPSASSRPTTASPAASTKVRGRWMHKAGMEFRNLLSNYADPEQALGRDAVAVRPRRRQLQLPVQTASGGVASLVRPTRSGA